MYTSFQEICNESRAVGERNDCTVKAISIVTGRPYQEVHAICAKHGRRPRKGMYPNQWMAAIESMGFRLVDRTSEIRGAGGKTTRTVARVLPSRPFIIHTHRHVSGWNGRKLLDWAEGRMKKVQAAYEVVPIEQVSSKPKATVHGIDSEQFALVALGGRQGCTVKGLARVLETTEKGARNMIDRLRRKGHPVKNIGPGTFRLEG